MRTRASISALLAGVFVAGAPALAQEIGDDREVEVEEALQVEEALEVEAEAGGTPRPMVAWGGDDAPPEAAAAPGTPYADDDPDRRARPDYDGRGDPPRDPADPWLWIPRVLLSPLYLVSEFVLRRPIEWIVTEAERAGVFDLLFAEGDVGLFPTLVLDFGLSPSVGFYLFWNDAFVEHNQIRLRAATWGVDWIRGDVRDRLRLDDGRIELTIEGTALRRPDYVFHGVGARVLQSARSRFRQTRGEADVTAQYRWWRRSVIRAEAGFRFARFSNSRAGEIGIQDAVAQGLYALPDGFNTGYHAFRWQVEASVDTRRPRPAPGSGLRVDGRVEQGTSLQEGVGSWIRGDGRAGLFLDTGAQHILEVFGQASLVEPLTDDPVPFTELVELGDDPVPFGGFIQGQLRGRSAAALSLRYTYPVWVWLDATAFISVGNVFGERWQDFDVDLLRYTFGFGFQTVGNRDNVLTAFIAFGSEPFANGGDITSIRLTAGTQHGF
jgi:hypothetical protein